ncbi:hypothetical protein BGP77_12860 [Saccharospirillum sp. MSK14-1]|uniref:hypothetical protein n=1 Tax=Saccharospirillum sp. MSK14-1 TaxID=1897632 RepID=UPI000D39F6F1|nr:hypothetical protein [Saccharospirillum sp. MSK14-1]PTY37394.1 hypothetical protein BGP77_12860 [Saccharospirillum sp. MSK14-1]
MTLTQTRLYWAGGLTAALMVALSIFWFERHQRRHVQAPQQLLAHLGEVALGNVALDPAYLLVEALAEQQRLWLGDQLLGDLADSGHPDPEAAVAALLPRAGARLNEAAGLAEALTPRLQALPEPPWSLLVEESRHWQVQAGEHCLSLGFQGNAAPMLWQWRSFSPCPVASD